MSTGAAAASTFPALLASNASRVVLTKEVDEVVELHVPVELLITESILPTAAA